ncbi:MULTISPECIES: hypothetical protein [Pseudomonas]|nr:MULTISPECIES: hypothetical protein [Pseudomonas]OYT77870.1 MAG: hypothetical protein CFE48_17940 [Pseudomonas sp. PGPPP2]
MKAFRFLFEAFVRMLIGTSNAVKEKKFFDMTGLSLLEGRYRLHKEVSGGKSSTGFFGVDEETGRDVFVKFCIFPRSELERARFRNEASFLKERALFNGIIKKTPEYLADGELFDGKILYLVTERIHGTLLLDWLGEKFCNASLIDRLTVAYRVFGAAEHFSMFVTHRDLHPGNIILLNEDIDLHSKRPDYKTIILDWGQSYSRMHFEYSENDSDDMVTIHNGIGREITNSFYNLPPETFIDWEASGSEYNKYDSWAMGLLLYKLVTGKDLFSFKNIGEYAAAQKRIEWEVKFGLFDLSAYAASAAPILSALIVQLLRKDPKDRMFIQEARHALWFILVEDFMPSDFGMIQRFLDAPNYFDEVKWKHFDSEPFDYF